MEPQSQFTANNKWTLRHHLSTERPQLMVVPGKKSKANTRSKTDVWRMPTRIKKWEDFTSESLMQCCDGIFAEMLDYEFKRVSSWQFEDAVTMYHDEPSLENAYVSQWTHPIIRVALKHAQETCCDRDIHGRGMRSPFVEMVPGGVTAPNPAYKPDWAGIRVNTDTDRERIPNILPGDTKLSYKWKGQDIIEGEVEPRFFRQNWFQPLKQIFTYCLANRTRYGYIVSSDEVVAVRVGAPAERLLPGGQNDRYRLSDERGTLEYFPIPYTTQQLNEPGMTMNIAIWALHLLAANKRIIREKYDPLRDEVLEGLRESPTPMATPTGNRRFRGLTTVNTRSSSAAERASTAPTERTGTSTVEPEDPLLASFSVDTPTNSFGLPSPSFASPRSATRARSRRRGTFGEAGQSFRSDRSDSVLSTHQNVSQGVSQSFTSTTSTRSTRSKRKRGNEAAVPSEKAAKRHA